MLVSHLSLSLIRVHQLLSYSAMILSSVNASFSCSFTVAFNHAKMHKLFSTADTPYKILVKEVRFSLLQKFLFVWCVQYLPPASAMVGGNVDECQKRVHMIFEEPESLYAIFASVFCPFGSHLVNKTLQCTFLKCLKVSVWNAWYGFNSHRKSFSGVLELSLQIVVMPTPENYQ